MKEKLFDDLIKSLEKNPRESAESRIAEAFDSLEIIEKSMRENPEAWKEWLKAIGG